ncbi:hypothetical protein NE237_023782 [Protea cynaroides]|uniref:Uncharacterized protein n=1 Tax=Protea cynaroides TaxID=273540 RepID=A0A9Q0K6S8_9MAGN|nr:hypothetical protein NE237_023782 [Protea cynaroides]
MWQRPGRDLLLELLVLGCSDRPKDPVPRCMSRGARTIRRWSYPRETCRFNLRLLEEGDLATSRSNASKFTSHSTQSKMRDSRHVPVSGKQDIQSTSSSITSSSIR